MSSSPADWFISGGSKFSDFGGFTNWLFAAALVGGMAREVIHLAETAAAPRDVVFTDKSPETHDEKSLTSITGVCDAFHKVDGISLQWSIWEAIRIRHGFR